ncbi:MAG: ATP-binding protein [Pseudomonadota bacterium]
MSLETKSHCAPSMHVFRLVLEDGLARPNQAAPTEIAAHAMPLLRQGIGLSDLYATVVSALAEISPNRLPSSPEERLAQAVMTEISELAPRVSDPIASGLSPAQEELVRLRARVAALESERKHLLRRHQDQTAITRALTHDIASPVNSAVQALGFFLEDNAHTDVDLADIVATIGVLTRVKRTVADIARFSVAAEMEQEPQRVSLDEVVHAVLEESSDEGGSPRRGVSVGPLPCVTGTRAQLTMLFRSLIQNALTYHAPEAMPEVSIRQVPAGVSCVVIEVTDNGIGIAPKFHGRIFEMFERLHAQDEYPGAGLGLALCQRIATSHGGWIAVRSELGAGATFQVGLRR